MIVDSWIELRKFALIAARHLDFDVTAFDTKRKVQTIMVDKQGESSAEFWHKILHTIPKFTNAFIEIFASDHLQIRATLTRGYKLFH